MNWGAQVALVPIRRLTQLVWEPWIETVPLLLGPASVPNPPRGLQGWQGYQGGWRGGYQ